MLMVSPEMPVGVRDDRQEDATQRQHNRASTLSEVKGNRLRATVSFAVCVVADAVWLVTLPVVSVLRWPALVIVVGAHLWCVVEQRRNPTVHPRTIIGAAGVLVVLAVVLYPWGSADVWSYTLIGRMVAVHRSSPYTHYFDAFPRDPLLHLVAPAYRRTYVPYGPAFLVFAGAGAKGFGTSPLLARLYFQVVAALALLGSLLLLARRGTARWVLVLVGLAPALLVAVNAGHVDVPLGFGLLVALLLVQDDHHLAAGVVLAVLALVKLSLLPVIAAVVLALVVARRWRAAVTLAVPAGAVVFLGYLLGGGADALSALQVHSRFSSRGSITSGVLWAYDQFGVAAPHLLSDAASRSGVVALVAVVAFGAFAWRHRTNPDPALFAVVAFLVYLLTASFALSWYTAAFIPALALVPTRVRGYAMATVVLLQVVYVAPLATEFDRVPGALVPARLAPIFEVALLVLLAWGTVATRSVTGAAPVRPPPSSSNDSSERYPVERATSG